MTTTLYAYLVGVRVAPGTVRGITIYAEDAGRACTAAETFFQIGCNEICVAVTSRRVYR